MRATEQSELANARFVFRGTVIANARARAKQAEVRVDEILEAPSVLAGYNGRNVYVLLSDGEPLTVDETAIFYGGGYEFGERLTVHVVGVDRGAEPLAAARAPGWDPGSAAKDRRMRERLQQASVVVAGIVESVRVPERALAAATRAASVSPTEPEELITEHAPHWREAVVRVTRVHKGEHRGEAVVVRYPASNDVRWFRAPKLQAGQRGVFALHAPTGAAAARPTRTARRAAAAQAPYCTIDPADVQPIERQEEIARLIEPPTPGPLPGKRGVRRSSTRSRTTRARRLSKRGQGTGVR